uniref:Uncharacterized protein n=1 Tax=Romanomermis culicivorax TaxID=13658 RepID=A0A915IRZ4_ROMCU
MQVFSANNRLLSVDTLNNIPMVLPFTFTVDSISVYQYFRFDPDGCSNKNFSINFSPKDDYLAGGDIILSIEFFRAAKV